MPIACNGRNVIQLNRLITFQFLNAAIIRRNAAHIFV